jgi:hypothetical protein
VLDIARTPAKLFRQMREQGRALAEMELVRRAYDFGTPLHSGRFEVDGTPFHTHGLGVASVVAHVGAPAHVVASAVLHNVYSTGDWGDGRGGGPHPTRRKRLREAVGADAEANVNGLCDFRARRLFGDLLTRPDDLTDVERWLVLLELGDLLDKWDDGRVTYSVDGRGDRKFVEDHQNALVAFSGSVAGPELAESFRSAFARVAAEEIPDSLRLGRRYSVVVPPPSWRPRTSLKVLSRARPILGPVRQRLSTFRRNPTIDPPAAESPT